MSQPLLSVRRVGKCYPSASRSASRLRALWDILIHGNTTGGQTVLEATDFDVYPGQSMGVIGANGAGKSTLLKLITGVLAPSSGEIHRTGSQAALLELGAGFDPQYTGMENLRMNAALLGLTRQQVSEKLDDILSFADIGDSIDEPIKHYSSGMVVRLGFAIVAAVRPDLLITDEVLAVGDESFQKKCIRWIENYLADGGTLLMVSHNMYQVQKLCQQAIWLEAGSVRAFGDVFDVTQAYLAWHERCDASSMKEASGKVSGQAYGVHHLEVITDGVGEPRVLMGAPLTVQVALRSPDGRAPVALLGLVRADGTPVYGVASEHDDVTLSACEDGFFRAELQFPSLPLLPGGYVVRGHAMDPEGLRVHDTAEVSFTVTGRSRELGLVRLKHRWVT